MNEYMEGKGKIIDLALFHMIDKQQCLSCLPTIFVTLLPLPSLHACTKLVPRHVLLSDEEKRELLDRYKLRENQLPRLKSSDPVAQYFGAQRGQVCD